MADQVWPGQDPVGQRFYVGGMDPYRDDWLTVVGVVAEARPWSSAPGTVPTYYVDYRQRPAFLAFTGAEVVVRTRAGAAAAQLVRDHLSALDGGVPLRIATLDSRLAAGTADRRFVLSLLSLFAGLALLASAVGIWGIVSFIVSRSSREAGIRLALGARPGQVLRSVQAQTVAPVGAGIAAGLLGTTALIGLVRSLLYGVRAFDPITVAAVCVTIVVTAWIASYLPARRMLRVNPAATLRGD
jgi:putative ABC transport system permease protein